MTTVENFHKGASIVAIVLGSLNFLAALLTFCFIKSRKSLSQLQAMTFMLLIISLAQTFGGIAGIYYNGEDPKNFGFIMSFIGRNIVFIQVFAVNWAVSFKFWESVQKLSQFLLSTIEKPGDREASEDDVSAQESISRS